MFLHIFFSLVSHLCPISNSYIGHGTLQKFIASKLSKLCWKSRHFLSVFHTGVFKQWCGASWSPIVPPLVVSCRKKFKMLHFTSTLILSQYSENKKSKPSNLYRLCTTNALVSPASKPSLGGPELPKRACLEAKSSAIFTPAEKINPFKYLSHLMFSPAW